ncbi:fumarylacetoacetate hydrolase family protein [Methylibium sp.]|uniref:fumarylacetoacetate hydrolase family protein n=1 Tax=Methylibium sp. TaxID=2067992 RepID=UPI003D132EFE
MRLVAFRSDGGQPALGARLGQELVDLTALGLPTTLDELLRQGEAGFAAARDAVTRAKVRRPLAGLRYLPPIALPSKAFAAGLNFVDHAAESPYKDPPAYPVMFQRFPSSWVAHGEALVRPKVSEQFDYEAELVVVIGRPGRAIPKARALEHVAGYSLFNDGSVRDYQLRVTQWMIGKNFDRSGSFGPEFVTADELPPGAKGLQLQCRLNGRVLQNANTNDMIFDVPALIEACSEAMALVPGDIIIAGTPSGVGFARKPPVFMRAGDVCEVEVEGLGLLRNPVIDEED